MPIHVLKCFKSGPGAARNLGATYATGDWILFNDSDCIPTESLLIGYLQADNFSVGYAGNIRSLGKDKLSEYYETQEILIPLKIYDENGRSCPQYLITANALVWKRAFVEINGFNENIGIAGGEDVDLGLRLSCYGALSYAFESIALHDFSDGLLGFYRRFRRYGKGNRMIEQIWATNMKPRPFKPNQPSLFNYIVAYLQYLFLLGGYLNEQENIERNKK